MNSNSILTRYLDCAACHYTKSVDHTRKHRDLVSATDSPELNPVERLWKFIKFNTLHNRLYDSLGQLERRIVDFFSTLTNEILMKLSSCSYI